jgi:hypothetical protein
MQPSLARFLDLLYAIFRRCQAGRIPRRFRDLGTWTRAFDPKVLDRVAGHISVPRRVPSLKIPIHAIARGQPEEIVPARGWIGPIRAEGIYRRWRGRIPPHRVTGITNRNQGAQQDHQEARNSHTGSPDKPNYTLSAKLAKPGLSSKHICARYQRGALGTGWGRAVTQSPALYRVPVLHLRHAIATTK